MSKSEDSKSVEARRGFLKLAGAGTILGGAAIAVGGNAQAEEAPDTKTSGYRETAHVKKYYELNRF
ncbi:MAG: twin-arginine translocation signal domain-containing protein [Rhizobiaceae bacterium]|nr:twin-arginine translocation signal domain-containing protein [Rhizobiaceae bacterium]